MMATHATEILKRHNLSRIMRFGDGKPQYLQDEKQRVKLITGLGDEYDTFLEKARISKAILFVVGLSDARILEGVAGKLGIAWPNDLAVKEMTDSHPDRLKFYRNLLPAIDGLRAVSIRDRDKGEIKGVAVDTLLDKGVNTDNFPDFSPRTWRRLEIENYCLNGEALAAKFGEDNVKEWWEKRGWKWPHDLSIDEHLIDVDVKKPLKDLFGSASCEDFLVSLDPQYIHSDLRIVIEAIARMKS